MKIRRHYTFYGEVQGVGFRYRAYHLANALRLTGWIKNEWDGSVEMEVQGEQADIRELIFRLQQLNYVHIERMEVKEMETALESGFRIR